MTVINSVKEEDKQHSTIELGVSLSVDNGLDDSEMYNITQTAINALIKVHGVKGVGYSDIEVRTVNVDKRVLEYHESWG